jgi:hypothetical protein
MCYWNDTAAAKLSHENLRVTNPRSSSFFAGSGMSCGYYRPASGDHRRESGHLRFFAGQRRARLHIPPDGVYCQIIMQYISDCFSIWEFWPGGCSHPRDFSSDQSEPQLA